MTEPWDTGRTVDELVSDAEDAYAASRGLPERLAEVTGESAGRDGLIIVRCGPGGAMIDLRLTPGALRLAPAELGRRIVARARAAADDARQRELNILARVIGDEAMALAESDRPAPARADGWFAAIPERESIPEATDTAPRGVTMRRRRVQDQEDDYEFDAWGRQVPRQY